MKNVLMILYMPLVWSGSKLLTRSCLAIYLRHTRCLPNTCRRRVLVAYRKEGKSEERIWLFTCVDQAQCLDNRLISCVALRSGVPSAYLQLLFPHFVRIYSFSHPLLKQWARKNNILVITYLILFFFRLSLPSTLAILFNCWSVTDR